MVVVSAEREIEINYGTISFSFDHIRPQTTLLVPVAFKAGYKERKKTVRGNRQVRRNKTPKPHSITLHLE